MRRPSIIPATAIATGLVIGLLPNIAAAETEPSVGAEIVSPANEEIVVGNTLDLLATDPGLEDKLQLNWAVRPASEGCDDPVSLFGGGRFVTPENEADAVDIDGDDFTATIDLDLIAPGEYCFVFNPGPADDGNRAVSTFYVVDEYVEIGGGFNLGDGTVPGNSTTHVVSGLVGDAGGTIVGGITVHYRALGESVTYEADSLDFRPAAGISAFAPKAVAEIGAGDAELFVLDKDASPDYERGAVIVRPGGAPGTGEFEVDSTPGATGADSWVGLERGNAHNN